MHCTVFKKFQSYLSCCFLELDPFTEGQWDITSFRLVQISLKKIEFCPQQITWLSSELDNLNNLQLHWRLALTSWSNLVTVSLSLRPWRRLTGTTEAFCCCCFSTFNCKKWEVIFTSFHLFTISFRFKGRAYSGCSQSLLQALCQTVI